MELRTRTLTLVDVLAMSTLALFTLGLAYHSVILIAETGSAAPASYLRFDLASSRACAAHPLTGFRNLEVIAFPALGLASLPLRRSCSRWGA